MQDEHARHGSMDTQMMRHHYMMLGLNLTLSFVIMYFVMFAMIWSFGDFFNNSNMFYMALAMASPMGILMLLMMGTMYRNRRLNAVLYAAFALIFILSFAAIRAQGLVGDRQFARAMIPHHSGAILMCERAAIRDPELKYICFKPNGIIESQVREIAELRAILERLQSAQSTTAALARHVRA